MKRRIRLTESDLRKIVRESVKRSLNEYYLDFMNPDEAENLEDYDKISDLKR